MKKFLDDLRTGKLFESANLDALFVFQKKYQKLYHFNKENINDNIYYKRDGCVVHFELDEQHSYWEVMEVDKNEKVLKSYDGDLDNVPGFERALEQVLKNTR